MSQKVLFHQETTFNIGPGILGTLTAFTVPPLTTLVIEQVSASATLPAGQKMLWYIVSTTVGGAKASYFFDPANNSPKNISTHRVRIYAFSNTQVELFADRDQPQGVAAIAISVSGYRVEPS